MQLAGTRLSTIAARDFVCQSRNTCSCVRDNFLPNGILITIPLAAIVNFLGNRKVITGCFFIWIFPETIERCGEDGLQCLLALPSSLDESVLKDGLGAERTTLLKHILFPIVKGHNVPCARYSSCCFLHGMSRSQSVSDKSRAHLFANAFTNIGLVVPPMNCCISLLFFLIIMTHHSRNHFGYRC